VLVTGLHAPRRADLFAFFTRAALITTKNAY